MRKRIIALAMIVTPTIFFVGCVNNDNGIGTITEQDVVNNYAKNVFANYQDAFNDAKALQTAVSVMVENPTQKTFDEAKAAWLKSRESYGPSEAFRLCAEPGPIDNENGPEGLLNAWPLDEGYIDYIAGQPNAGVINDLTTYPTLSKELLEGLNEEGGEANISIGYHAIEFLLWGQDLTDPSENKAGLREFTDYTTAANADRRGQYIKICSELIVDHLQLLINEWNEGGAYRTEFTNTDAKSTLSNVLTGIARLSKGELAGERMYVALEGANQEDEHSCFSDNTHRDIRLNFEGIENVINGTYGSNEGASFKALLEQKSEAKAKDLEDALTDAKTKVYATGIPFDIAISGGQETVEGAKVLQAVVALQKLGDELVLSAKALDLDITAED